jgi:hypothetical protein
MKKFLIGLLLVLATCSVALSKTSTNTKAKTPSMAGISVKGNVVRYSAAWKVGKKADGTMFLFKKKPVIRQVLVVTCKCSSSGRCYLRDVPPDGLKCERDDCTGTCSVKLEWVTTTDPIEVETP